MNEKYKVAGYLRLSQEDGDKDVSDSIVSQKNIIDTKVKELGNDFYIVDYYIDENPGFNPYAGEGTKIGSANIVTPSPPCRICPQWLGFMIDACGPEAQNEFIVIWTGSGFNTSNFTVDFDSNNNGGAGNGDIGSACGIVPGPAGLIGGCSAISVGANVNLPANAMYVVFTSVGASTNYDFSGICDQVCNVYVSSSACARTIGAFSNYA